MPAEMRAEKLGILLLSGAHDRAHYAFLAAAAAAALGRDVVLFASNGGCHALLQDWSGLQDASRDDLIQASGVAGLDTLRAASAELGVRLLVCESGLLAEGLHGRGLLPGVEIVGIATFLVDLAGAQLLTI